MAEQREKSADQMKLWKESRGSQKPDVLTTGGGNPICDKLNLMTVGPRGPLLVQDVVFTDEMAHFDRERIPERVVHAKGAGAFGYFEVTHDISKYSKAKVFEYIGKRTPIAVRFSTVAGESGSSDTVRDPRGFAVKFYTEDGNWDLTGNNTPIFFIRDAMLFPSFIHSQKRNPQTHMKDPDMVWDFWALRPESLHQVSFLFSDRGIPDGHRHMNGYGSHTFKLVNAKDEPVYCKFHYKTNQGIRNLTVEEANRLAAADPDYGIHDLYESIANGDYPSWTFYIQVMTFEQAEKYPFNPFDLTKIWPHKDYPLIPVGKLVLNRNPANYFAEVEQMAFDPSNMPPGIEPSPDKMLQGRLFSYPDTHRHRLGANYLQLPVNCPYKARVANYQRDGPMCFSDNQAGAPNYYPNSFSAPDGQPSARECKFRVSADVARFNSSDEDNVSQVRDFFNKVLSEEERQRLCANIAGHLKDAQVFIQKRAVKNFSDVDPKYGSGIEALLNKYNAEGHIKASSVLTTGAGVPTGDKLNVLTVGPLGPLLVQDTVFIDEMAHFDRERIPERVVHAKGAGAFGYFEVTHDITRYTKAKVFESIGKRTDIAVRFSTVAGEVGSADTVRDPRGFAVKFYTDEGIWDLVGNNTPIFFIRDPILFPSFIHSQKRNPQTHLKDPDMVWDFWSLRPESLHQVAILFSDRGIPDGYRFMNGYGSHTFKLVNAKGKAVYCKFHYKSNQGIKNLSVEEADRLVVKDPDYAIRDLFQAIAKKDFPSWTMYIQVMTFKQAEACAFNPFDLTKVWPHKDFPLIPVGKLVLNRNPENYFADVEQIAFAPSNMPPGIEPSPDKMLQGRLFSYPDTHRHRLGANYLHLPVNCPRRCANVCNYQQDGPMCIFSASSSTPNYYPNSFSSPQHDHQHNERAFRTAGDVARHDSSAEDNVSQVRNFYKRTLNEAERQRLCENIAEHLKDAQIFIQERAVKNFRDVDPDYGSRIQTLLDKHNKTCGKKEPLHSYIRCLPPRT